MGEEKPKEINSNFNVDAAFDYFSNIKFPHWDNLPDIELYMDQVIVLMEKYLSRLDDPANLEVPQDKTPILTPSMVNNYVKKEYMPAPIKKKYGREHIAHLLIICIMKQSLPISVIDFFIKTLLEVMDIEQLLNMFIDSYEACFTSSVSDMHESYDEIKETIDDDFTPKAIMAIRATALANAGKLVGEIVNDSLCKDNTNDNK